MVNGVRMCFDVIFQKLNAAFLKDIFFLLVKQFLSQAKEEFNQKWEKPAQV